MLVVVSEVSVSEGSDVLDSVELGELDSVDDASSELDSEELAVALVEELVDEDGVVIDAVLYRGSSGFTTGTPKRVKAPFAVISIGSNSPARAARASSCIVLSVPGSIVSVDLAGTVNF